MSFSVFVYVDDDTGQCSIVGSCEAVNAPLRMDTSYRKYTPPGKVIYTRSSTVASIWRDALAAGKTPQ